MTLPPAAHAALHPEPHAAQPSEAHAAPHPGQPEARGAGPTRSRDWYYRRRSENVAAVGPMAPLLGANPNTLRSAHLG